MRGLVIGSILLGAAAVVSPAQATELDISKCVFPAQAPTVPDGSVASQDEMVAASAAVKAYVTENESGLACLDAAKAAFGEEPLTEEQHATYARAYNTAVDAAKQIGDNWNVAVRAFKAKNPG